MQAGDISTHQRLNPLQALVIGQRGRGLGVTVLDRDGGVDLHSAAPHEEGSYEVSGGRPGVQVLVDIVLGGRLCGASVHAVEPVEELDDLGDLLFRVADRALTGLPGCGVGADASQVMPGGEAVGDRPRFRSISRGFFGGQPLFEQCQIMVTALKQAVLLKDGAEVLDCLGGLKSVERVMTARNRPRHQPGQQCADVFAAHPSHDALGSFRGGEGIDQRAA